MNGLFLSQATGFLGKMGWKPSLQTVEEAGPQKSSHLRGEKQLETSTCHEGDFSEDF